MNVNELISIEVGRILNNPALLTEMLKYYKELFNVEDNQINASCEKCLKDYYKQIKFKIMANNKDTESKEFQLKNDKAGNSLRIRLAFGSSNFYFNDNLTEDIALEYLSKNPNRISQFEKYPEDWEERIAEISKEEEAKKLAKEKAKAEKLAKKKEEEDAKKEAEELAKKKAEEDAERARLEAEELAKKEEEEKAKQEAEEKAKAEKLAKEKETKTPKKRQPKK